MNEGQPKKGLVRERRIGTVTLGVCLVGFGILFLIHIFGGALNYLLIFHCWPIILIVLGCEILFYTCRRSEGKEGAMVVKYDFGAIIILLLIVGFSMCMAGADWILTNAPTDVWRGW